MRKLKSRRLFGHHVRNSRIAMTNKVHDGAGSEVENLAALSVVDPHTFATNSDRIRLVQGTMQHCGTRDRDP
jgi:hypothetical protein